jgi:hypothetical protein
MNTDKLFPISYLVKGTPYTIVWRDSNKWAVIDCGYTLSKSGEWEYEPTPSNRTEEYLKNCRFDSVDEAFTAIEGIK